MRKSVGLLLLVLVMVPQLYADTDDAGVCDLPINMSAPNHLRRQIVVMRQRSVTFRQQCQRLDVPGFTVHIRSDVQLVDRPYRARTTIARVPTGLVAFVTIAAFGDPTEWLAHEFEHIIEQLDGVNLARLAEVSRHEAWCSGDSMFETMRALRVGRLVVGEVRAAGRTVAHARRSDETQRRAEDPATSP